MAREHGLCHETFSSIKMWSIPGFGLSTLNLVLTFFCLDHGRLSSPGTSLVYLLDRTDEKFRENWAHSASAEASYAPRKGCWKDILILLQNRVFLENVWNVFKVLNSAIWRHWSQLSLTNLGQFWQRKLALERTTHNNKMTWLLIAYILGKHSK